MAPMASSRTLTATPARHRSANAFAVSAAGGPSSKTYCAKVIVFCAPAIALSLAGKISSPFSSTSRRFPPTGYVPAYAETVALNDGLSMSRMGSETCGGTCAHPVSRTTASAHASARTRGDRTTRSVSSARSGARRAGKQAGKMPSLEDLRPHHVLPGLKCRVDLLLRRIENLAGLRLDGLQRVGRALPHLARSAGRIAPDLIAPEPDRQAPYDCPHDQPKHRPLSF